MSLRPAKTQISLGMKKAWVLSYPLNAQRILIRLGGCPGWSEFSLSAQSLCWFCHVVAQVLKTVKLTESKLSPPLTFPEVNQNLLTSGKVKGGERRRLGARLLHAVPKTQRGSNTPPSWRPLGYLYLYLYHTDFKNHEYFCQNSCFE